MYNSIRPGKTWYDTEGKRIQAHGGSIICVDGTFYWYGENKEGVTGTATGERCKFWHHGVRLYSSKDLYNWKDEGIIVPESEDENNPFYPSTIMDRPHILYNEKTKKFVLWAKTAKGGFKNAVFSVCEGDTLFTLEYKGDALFPSTRAGDFDLFTDGDSAYIVYENPHSEMILQRLTDDYTQLTDAFSSHIQRECPPLVREAPCYFVRNGRKFILTSGTTGYFPNPTIAYDITAMSGEWKELGETCRGDKNRNSFHAQFSSVFRHPFKKDLYIALGDRWLTDLTEDLPDMEKVFYDRYSGKNEGVFDFSKIGRLSEENTDEADYVWLPVRFDENGNPYLEWLREWNTDDFD